MFQTTNQIRIDKQFSASAAGSQGPRASCSKLHEQQGSSSQVSCETAKTQFTLFQLRVSHRSDVDSTFMFLPGK